MATVANGLANDVRARRVQLRLRQEELADLAGVSERFVYALENGKQTVQLDKLLAVLNALGLHLELHRGADSSKRMTQRQMQFNKVSSVLAPNPVAPSADASPRHAGPVMSQCTHGTSEGTNSPRNRAAVNARPVSRSG